MADYQINVELSRDTAEQLIGGGYSLYAFRAVSGPAGGVPLVWFKSKYLRLDMTVKWSEMYDAYVSDYQSLESNVEVRAGRSFERVDLGDIVTIQDASGGGEVSTGGQPLAITIRNNSSTAFVTGISQQNPEDEITAMCAFPLHAHVNAVISPVERVLLMFASKAVDTGTVIKQAFGPGLLFDMTAKAGEPVSVRFDIDKGWEYGTQTICTKVGFGKDLIPLLILPRAWP